MAQIIFSKPFHVGKRSTFVFILPHLKDAIDIFSNAKEITTSSSEYVTKRNHNFSSDEWIHVPENTEWVVITEGSSADIYITEHTKKIEGVDFGNGLTDLYNNFIQQTKNEYFKKKKTEVRLYFWDSQKKRLRLCSDSKTSSFCPSDEIAYYVRHFSAGQAIDKRYKTPEQDCFILGKIRKTIGTHNSKLFDYIEPIIEIKLDFVKEEWDFGDFRRNVDSLEEILLNLFVFCTCYNNEKTEDVKFDRIRAYLRNTKHLDSPDIQVFMDEVKTAFKKGDVKQLRKLEDVVYTPQDCSNVAFTMKYEDEDFTCGSNKHFTILFENGESNYVSAEWIYQNRHLCRNAIVVYYEFRNKYNFSAVF